MPSPKRSTDREKIAILGGGVGAVAAAFALTEGENADRYDITIYQVGWRLGGKGASGRRMGEKERRIEEHGIHIWFGFYDNALGMMERCYDALDDPRETFATAFTEQRGIVLEDRVGDAWVHYPLAFPTGRPKARPAPLQYAEEILRWIIRLWTPLRPLDGLHSLGFAFGALQRVQRMIHGGKTDDRSRLFQLVGELRALAGGWLVPLLSDPLGALSIAATTASNYARWTWMLFDLGLTVVRGMIADNVITRGFESIDDYDLWEWLSRHGADPRHEHCVMIRGLYTQAFAFPGGREKDRSIAAGTALKSSLRMLLRYKGAFMRKMNAGMGDIVFAPFYRVLKQRGVRFKFFHRVRKLHLSPTDSGVIDAVTIGRQLRVKAPASPVFQDGSCCPDEPAYDPLVEVYDSALGIARRCWPNEPRPEGLTPASRQLLRTLRERGEYTNLESVWTALDERHETTCTLRRGLHFDKIVLAISVGGLREICSELVAASPEWRAMLATTKTVRTQAFQLWLRPSIPELGWQLEPPILGAYQFPYDTWGDMNQTRGAEGWPHDETPGHIAYFCGMLSDDVADPPWSADATFPKRMRDAAYVAMRDFLCGPAAHLWPSAVDNGVFRWELLMDGRDGDGEDRLRHQFWVANIDPTERYVLSVPGSIAKRLPSDDSKFRNLFLAGDWTYNTVNLGCVEAAVSSGMAAARGVAGGYTPYPILG